MIRFGIPSDGALHKDTIEFLSGCGLEIVRPNPRSYTGEIVDAPGPGEIEASAEIDAISITNNEKSINLMELAGLIKKSNYIIANDTGPAHMAAHLGKEGTDIFGHHTTPKKVSRETARMVLPMCTKTKIYMTGPVRSWIHFFRLRDDSHAQKEITLLLLRD